jgi:ADP-ribose pyrophosphatase
MKTIFEGDHVLVLEHDGWQYVERKTAKTGVAVVAETPDGELVLTEQFRRPVQARVIDWPAGLVGDEGDDDPERTAKKELEEETGWAAASVELLATGPTSPGITSEIIRFYGASGLRRVGQGGGVGGEEIKVHLVPRQELSGWLRRQAEAGCLIDVKIWAGLQLTSARDNTNNT